MQEGLSLMWKNLSLSVGALDRAEAEIRPTIQIGLISSQFLTLGSSDWVQDQPASLHNTPASFLAQASVFVSMGPGNKQPELWCAKTSQNGALPSFRY